MRNQLAVLVRKVPLRAVDALGSLVGSIARRHHERTAGRSDGVDPVASTALPTEPRARTEGPGSDRANAGCGPDLDLATACSTNQALVVDLCERAGIDYFAVIEPMARAGRIAVADHDWPRLAAAITAAGLHDPFDVDCWDAANGQRRARNTADPQLHQAMLDSLRLLVFRQFDLDGSPTVLGRPYGCTIERWSVDEDQTLRSPTVNEIAQVIGTEAQQPVPALVLGRTVRTLAPFTATNALAADFPIDAVIPWVDDTDPVWSARRLQQLAGQHDPASGERPVLESGAPGDPDLLRYTLRSLRDNLPWLRTVFLVTDGQVPPWLMPEDDSVRIVEVNDLLEPRGVVPTFNPGAVRAVLHHIEGLAEHFLLIESGAMIKRHLRPTDFFLANGVITMSFARDTLPQANGAASSIDLSTRTNVVDLLHQEFGRHPTRAFAPGHSVQRRSILNELEHRFPDTLKRTWCSQFPASTDFDVSGWLHHYYAYFTGRGTPAGLTCAYVDQTGQALKPRLRDLGRARVDTVTFGNGRAASAPARALVEATLRKWFPVPAGHELYSIESPGPDRTWA